MNNRRTLLTELGVFEKFTPHLPESYKRSPFVLLANIAPSLQHRLGAAAGVGPAGVGPAGEGQPAASSAARLGGPAAWPGGPEPSAAGQPGGPAASVVPSAGSRPVDSSAGGKPAPTTSRRPMAQPRRSAACWVACANWQPKQPVVRSERLRGPIWTRNSLRCGRKSIAFRRRLNSTVRHS